MPTIREGDRVSLTGEVTHEHGNGTITVRVRGFSTPITLGAEYVDVIERVRQKKPLRDRPD